MTDSKAISIKCTSGDRDRDDDDDGDAWCSVRVIKASTHACASRSNHRWSGDRGARREAEGCWNSAGCESFPLRTLTIPNKVRINFPSKLFCLLLSVRQSKVQVNKYMISRSINTNCTFIRIKNARSLHIIDIYLRYLLCISLTHSLDRASAKLLTPVFPIRCSKTPPFPSLPTAFPTPTRPRRD